MTEARAKAWKTRRQRYGNAGHAGTYARSYVHDRMTRLVAKMVADGTLSEGQVCQETGIDRIALRRLVEPYLANPP